MHKLELKSPAKINIGLNVLQKRKDGFHDLETIFYPLLLSDLLKFEKSNSTKFESNNHNLEKIENNLILQAIKSIEQYCGGKFNVNVYLEKNIPIGAGLGGGSSNAATTLKALNSLFELCLNHEEISEIAINLGSDVPYFLNPVPSLGLSRGEILSKIDLQISQPILIVNPGIHISTNWAFNNIDLKKTAIRIKRLSDLKKFSFLEVAQVAINDFEDVVLNKYHDIKNIKERLLQFGAAYSSMSGTGSTVYGIFSNLQQCRKAEEFFKKDYFTFLNYPVDKGSIT